MTTETGAARISLRPGVCSGHAQCHGVDGDLFPLDEGGYSALAPAIVAPDDMVKARMGVASCPERALVLELLQDPSAG